MYLTKASQSALQQQRSRPPACPKTAAPPPQLLKLAQLQLQYLSHELARAQVARERYEDGALALAQGLAAMPAPSLGDVRGGLGTLGGGVAGLGRARVDEILRQVRGQGPGGCAGRLVRRPLPSPI